MPKRNEEILNCDSIKIVMMISVILYHSMALWNRGGWFDQLPSSSSPSITFIATWLNSIHIYTFVFISGYLFYFLKYEIGKYQKYKEFIWRKIVRLIVPYCSAAILWCVPFYQYFFKGNLVGIFKNYILAISPSQLWFLVALFMIMCVFYWISIGLEKLNSRTFDLFIFVFLFFLNIGSSLLPNIFQISNTSRFILFFYCGYCFRRNDFNFLHNINGLIYLIIHIILFIVYYYLSGFSQSTYHYCGIFIYPFVNLSGILTVFIGVNRINSKWTINHDNQIFCFLKKYNFTMYLFHQQIIYCVITIFNGILCPAGLVATSFIVAFILSALMAWFLGKYKVTQFMFGIQGGKNN